MRSSWSYAALAVVAITGTSWALTSGTTDDGQGAASATIVQPRETSPAAADPALAYRTADANATPVRSVLYPSDWRPLNEGGSKTADGRFLQDFSYAGYAAGERSLPTGFGRSVNVVTQYGADNTYNAATNPNSADATAAIQNGIDAMCAAGGGVVNLPAGSYRIKPQQSATRALAVNCNNVILRGAVGSDGLPTSFLFNDEQDMHYRRVIQIGSPSDDGALWYNVQNDVTAITSASTDPTRIITLSSSSAWSVGDTIVVRTDNTAGFRQLHGMGPNQGGCFSAGCWRDNNGLLYHRRVVAKLSGNRVQLDAPVRYLLDPNTSTGNNPRVYRTAAYNYNIGVENISVGMRQNTKGGMTDENIEVPGTAAYETANAQIIRFTGVKDAWVKNVRTFRPAVNTDNVHILSIGIALTASTRNISVIDCHVGFPQNRLVSGNGYLYVLAGQDDLIENSFAESGRHNFLFSGMGSNGNVITGGESKNSLLNNDFHVGLVQANLIEGITTIGNGWQTINREYLSNGSGITGTQNVFWNIGKSGNASGYLVQSAQFGWGYIIGSKGITATVDVSSPSVQAPADWLEALNNGDNLQPQSLFLDQRAKRLADPSY